MNKVLLSTLLVGSLLLLNSPEAAADREVRDPHWQAEYRHYRPYKRDHHAYRKYRRDYQYARHRRSHTMPHWLHDNRSFRRWYGRSQLRHDRRLSWYRLFDAYRYGHH